MTINLYDNKFVLQLICVMNYTKFPSCTEAFAKKCEMTDNDNADSLLPEIKADYREIMDRFASKCDILCDILCDNVCDIVCLCDIACDIVCNCLSDIVCVKSCVTFCVTLCV